MCIILVSRYKKVVWIGKSHQSITEGQTASFNIIVHMSAKTPKRIMECKGVQTWGLWAFPGTSLLEQFQKRKQSNPFSGVWFQNLCYAKRQLHITGTASPPALAPVCSPPLRSCSTSHHLVHTTRGQHPTSMGLNGWRHHEALLGLAWPSSKG